MSALRIPPRRNGSGAVPQVLLGFGVLAAMGLAAFAWLAPARRPRRPSLPGAPDAESALPRVRDAESAAPRAAVAPELRSERHEPVPEAREVHPRDPKADT